MPENYEKIFESFFKEHYSKVYSFFKIFVKLDQDAEELTLDIFYKIWRKKEALSEIRNIDNYLFIASKRHAFDFLKSAAQNKSRQTTIDNEVLLNHPLSEYHGDEFENKEAMDHLLGLLTERRREIFSLNRIEGFTYKEIAEKLHISPLTVKNTIADTLKFLRKKVDSKEGLLLLCYFIRYIL